MKEILVTKRSFLASAAATLCGLAIGGCAKQAGAKSEVFEVMKSTDEWRAILTPAQYAVLRKASTERPRSSPLNNEHRRGIYLCAGCALPVYASQAKYESGTGWPSFTAPLKNAVGTRPDPGLFGVQTEVYCRRCGGHLGHVFADGPPPTGQRYCMNGVALEFRVA